MLNVELPFYLVFCFCSFCLVLSYGVLVVVRVCLFFFFFFQAEDGIRDRDVTGVQTCALPISARAPVWPSRSATTWCSSWIDGAGTRDLGLVTRRWTRWSNGGNSSPSAARSRDRKSVV